MPTNIKTSLMTPHTAIAAAVLFLLVAGCASIKRIPPPPETMVWLATNGWANDPAMIALYSPVEANTLGTANLDEAVPLASGAIYTYHFACDNTGWLTAFKWVGETVAQGAETVWSGAKAVPQQNRRSEAVLAREAAIVEGTP